MNRLNQIIFVVLQLCLYLCVSSYLGAENISIKDIEGRSWLVDSNGKPFFAHGVTHIGNKTHKVDFVKIGEACKELGFNAYGYGCPPNLKKDLPYIEGRNLVPNSTYRTDGSFTFVDVFDPKVKSDLERQVKQMCLSNRQNKNLIGYCWTDLGAWPLKNSTKKNWVQFMKDLPEGAPGHQAYTRFIKNSTLKNQQSQDEAFLRSIAKEYFKILGEANQKYDPDHLVFGDRFAFNTLDPIMIEEMLPWVYAIAIQPPFQPTFPERVYDEVYEMSGKPILICDFAIRFKEEPLVINGFKIVDNDKSAGLRYVEYIQKAFEKPDILGAFWCNPIDSVKGFNKPGVKQGIFRKGLQPRIDLNHSIREINQIIAKHTPKG